METNDFNQYVKDFKTKTLKEKQLITLEQLKMLAVLTNTMCKELNVENEIIVNNELIDVEKENYTEDDYVEAIMVLVNSIQNSLCDFDLKLSDLMKVIVDKES